MPNAAINQLQPSSIDAAGMSDIRQADVARPLPPSWMVAPPFRDEHTFVARQNLDF